MDEYTFIGLDCKMWNQMKYEICRNKRMSLQTCWVCAPSKITIQN